MIIAFIFGTLHCSKMVKQNNKIKADSPIPFAGDPLNYAEDKRDPECLQAFVAQTNARAILLYKGKIGIGNGGRPHRVHPSELIAVSYTHLTLPTTPYV